MYCLGTSTVQQSWQIAFDDPVTRIAAALMAVVVLVTAVLLGRALLLRKRLEREVGAYVRDPRTYVANLTPSYVVSMLREFHASLTDDRRSIHSDSHRLDTHRVLGMVQCLWFPFAFVQMAPGVLTALGILGTFFGISGALGGLTLDASFDTATLTTVIASLASAFWTSILGVVLGVAVGVLGRRAEARMEAAVAACNARLDATFQLRTPEADTDRVLASLDGVQQAIQAIPRDLKTEFGTVAATLFAPILQQAADLGIQAAQAHTAAFVNQTTAQVEAVMSRTLGVFSGHIAKLNTNLQQVSAPLVANLDNISTAVAHIDTTLHDAAAAVTSLGQGLADAVAATNKIRRDSTHTAKRTTDCVELIGSHIEVERKRQTELNDLVANLARVSATVMNGLDKAGTIGPDIQNLTTAATSMADAMNHTVAALTHYSAATHVAQQQFVEANNQGQELIENMIDLRYGTQAMLPELRDATMRLADACEAIRALSLQPQAT